MLCGCQIKPFTLSHRALTSRVASATSSGVLTLKNGSTGSAGHAASATPWRAVQTSILRRSSIDQRVAQIVAQRDLPQADHRMAPVARLRHRRAASRPRAAPRAGARPDRAAGTGSRPARSRSHSISGALRRRPVEPGEDAGERAGEVWHRVGNDRQPELGKARRIAIGVEDDARRIAASAARSRARGSCGRRSGCSALSPPPMRRARPPASSSRGRRWRRRTSVVMHGRLAPVLRALLLDVGEVLVEHDALLARRARRSACRARGRSASVRPCAPARRPRR